MKLTQIAANDAITKEVLQRVLTYSPLLSNHVEFYSKPGDSSTSRKEQGSLSVSSRALDNKYSEKPVKPEYITAGRKFIGDTVRIDVARERMGFDLASENLSQLMRLAPGIATKFHQTLINGDSSKEIKDFDGMAKMVVTGQTVRLATNGMIIQTGNTNDAKTSQQLFLEGLNETIGITQGINKVIIGNGKTLARLSSIAREYITIAKDEFGRPIAFYNGVPIIDIEQAGDSIIPFTEVCGTANDTASLYCASFEEEAGLSFLTTEEGFKVYEPTKVGNWYETMVELISDSALFRDKALARLSGIKL